MLKSALISALEAKYLDVPTPTLIDTYGDIKWYETNITEAGTSEKDKKPVAYRRTINFYVYKEGVGGEEAAYYSRTDTTNTVDKDVTAGDSSAYSYNKIYSSNQLRQRLNGTLVKIVNDIHFEAGSTPNHTSRVAFENSCMQNPAVYLNAFMIWLANDATIRSKGNSCTDTEIMNVVSGYVPVIVTAFGLDSGSSSSSSSSS